MCIENTLYGQFVLKMESIGFVRTPSEIKENDVELSEDDDAIYIMPNKCNALSIRGIRECKMGGHGAALIRPHDVYIKIYDYDRNEIKDSDAIRFSIMRIKKAALPSMPPIIVSHTIYYHYPYRLLSARNRFPGFKKGMLITKDEKLEIKVMRNDTTVKIGKFELSIKCDKWFLVS